ncbi:hypothetical protein BT96DRAFT_535874 [Gymnopus androsaceus JB14]|uniref:Uncharacterized protein n=1 Tax=Gymnopus androsaceus JB14 TaxID=1447944 RepID=A0A6A4HWR8_9AGAR|nr:hypothetical protein BT96DRAFT_535874 [Gymnopus androsaceus JB14]
MLLESSAGPSQRSSGAADVSPPTTFQPGTSEIHPGVESLPSDAAQPPTKLHPFNVYRCLEISVFLGAIPWFVSAVSLAILNGQGMESSPLAYIIFSFLYTIFVLYLHILVPWLVFEGRKQGRKTGHWSIGLVFLGHNVQYCDISPFRGFECH